MTVAQEAPDVISGTLPKELDSLFTLTLTEGDRADSLVFLGSELVEELSWVDSLGKYEDDRDFGAGFFIDFGDRGGLGLDELVALEVVNDVLLDSEVDTIRSEATENDHLLQCIVALGFPFTWKLSVFWVWLG